MNKILHYQEENIYVYNICTQPVLSVHQWKGSYLDMPVLPYFTTRW